MLQVFFHPKAQKELLNVPRNVRLRVIRALDEIEKLNHPLQHPKIIKLSGRRTADFRLRIGDYRVKFTLRNSRVIFVTHVQHRQSGY